MSPFKKIRGKRSLRKKHRPDQIIDYDVALKNVPGLGPAKVVSSQHVQTALGSDFAPEVAALVSRRRDKRGAEKGRVLYLIAGPHIAAVLWLHVPDAGPLEILGAGASSRNLANVREGVVAILIEHAQRVSGQLGRSTTKIAWVTNKDATASAIRATHPQFQPAPAPKKCQSKHYLLREASP